MTQGKSLRHAGITAGSALTARTCRMGETVNRDRAVAPVIIAQMVVPRRAGREALS